MTRWFTPASLQFSTTSWNQSRLRSKKKPTLKHRYVKQYQLLNEIAHGSTCVVYLALDAKSKKLYALKEMNLKKLQRQQRMDWLQARHPKHHQQSDGTKRRRIDHSSMTLTPANFAESDILHSLHHSHIVEWVDCFEENDNLYLVTEWVDGTVLVNLHDRLNGPQINSKEDNESSLNSSWRCIFTQLVDVLDHLHEQDIIHGDIKPGNILITKDNQIKLIDFGSAIKLDATDSSNNSNEDKNGDDMIKTAFQKLAIHRRKRTPAFTPPECIKKEITAHGITTIKHYETAADIWALGMTLYCMVYEKLPFQQPTNNEIDLYHLLRHFTTVPHNSTSNKDPQLCHLIDRMLSVSPMDRITLKQIRRHPWFLGIAATT